MGGQGVLDMEKHPGLKAVPWNLEGGAHEHRMEPFSCPLEI